MQRRSFFRALLGGSAATAAAATKMRVDTNPYLTPKGIKETAAGREVVRLELKDREGVRAIELDPSKKYIYLFDPSSMDIQSIESVCKYETSLPDGVFLAVRPS